MKHRTVSMRSSKPLPKSVKLVKAKKKFKVKRGRPAGTLSKEFGEQGY